MKFKFCLFIISLFCCNEMVVSEENYISEKAALRAISVFKKDPLSNDADKSIKIIFKFIKKSKNITVDVYREHFSVLSNMNKKHKRILLGAYLVGNVEYQLVNKVNGSATAEGIKMMVETYKKLRADGAFPEYDELEEWVRLDSDSLFKKLGIQSIETSVKSLNGKPVQRVENMKTVNGFGGVIFLTPDQNWEDKWFSSSNPDPKISVSHKLIVDKKLLLLIFFINPLLDSDDEISISCDIKIFLPDNEVLLNKVGLDCGSGTLPAKPGATDIIYSGVNLEIVGEKNDPPGRKSIEVKIRDENRNASVTLKSYYEFYK